MTINLTEKYDKELIREIQKYQKSKGYRYPVQAIRQLCKDALQLKKIVK